MVEPKRMSLLKPTHETPFHIDFDWWKENDRDWRVYLRSQLCLEHQKAFETWEEGQMIDWIDPLTAEVRPVDALEHVLLTHCAQQPDFVTAQTSLVEAVFRLFLVNSNMPMTVVEIGAKLNRPAETLLRTLTGQRIYKGVRPVMK
jgi:hypothetical protein